MTEAAERWSACSIETVAWPRTWRQPGDPRGGGDALAHTGRIPKQTLSGRDRERAGKLSPPATSSPPECLRARYPHGDMSGSSRHRRERPAHGVRLALDHAQERLHGGVRPAPALLVGFHG